MPDFEICTVRLRPARIDESSRSKTAANLGISIGMASCDQKTASEAINDKLAVRRGALMVSTRRLMAMSGELADSLRRVEGTKESRPFSSAECAELIGADNTVAAILTPQKARVQHTP